MGKPIELETGQVLRDHDGQLVLVAAGPVRVVRPIVPWDQEPELVREARQLACPDMKDGAGI